MILLAIKIICLFLALAYACPVIIGGAIHGNKVTEFQNLVFSIGITGFVSLQWLL